MSQITIKDKNNSCVSPKPGNLSQLEYSLDDIPLIDVQRCLEKAALWKEMHARVANFYNFR